MTAMEVVKVARDAGSEGRFAVNPTETVVAFWKDGRWTPVAKWIRHNRVDWVGVNAQDDPAMSDPGPWVEV